MPRQLRTEYVFLNPEDLPNLKQPILQNTAHLVTFERSETVISTDGTFTTISLRYHGKAGL